MIIKPLFVILVLVVFVLVWVFANTIDKRKWVSFLIAIVLTPFAYYYILYPVMNIFSSYHHEKYFETTAWKEKPAFRYEMLENLLQDSLLVKKSRQEVELLLGPSEWFGWDDNLKANSEAQWNYNLGVKPGVFNNMQECLEIKFVDNNVNDIRQYQIEQTFEEKD
ncbi:hypothetical protein [Seonamhaeicola sp. ML3]|uniref:hypothetical protein n=1 Tax=Seonamhaeicola sp. ML3 TaxID=2937786 RepID=UPI00200F7D83|nr:hypothetical protein [Seonamhaeicola sp. ML3]